MMRGGAIRIGVLLVFGWLFSSAAWAAPDISELTAEQIVATMTLRNRQRTADLRSYVGERYYHLLYKGFPMSKEAEMQVCASFIAPNTKVFSIRSQSGSPFIVNKVLKRLLESEQEAATEEQQKRTALSPDNYQFELLGREPDEPGRPYILRASPKVDSKFLYRGKVWVDASDFTVTKIEAEPARRPSIWISKTRIRHVYAKVGDFWLPAENHSTTDVRLGGVATLTIRYMHYTINQDRENCPASAPHPRQ